MTREIKFRAWVKKPEPRMIESLHFDFGWIYHPEKFIVMQYTGLKDKNGKEIYEGDIINGTINVTPIEKFKVIWDSGSFVYKQLSGNKFPHLIELIEDVEVIGNIYENPELLEE